MPKTIRYFMDLRRFSNPQDEIEKENIMNNPDSLWFSQSEVDVKDRQIERLKSLIIDDKKEILEELRK